MHLLNTKHCFYVDYFEALQPHRWVCTIISISQKWKPENYTCSELGSKQRSHARQLAEQREAGFFIEGYYGRQGHLKSTCRPHKNLEKGQSYAVKENRRKERVKKKAEIAETEIEDTGGRINTTPDWQCTVMGTAHKLWDDGQQGARCRGDIITGTAKIQRVRKSHVKLC